MSDTFDRVKKVVVERLKVSPDEVTEDAGFVEDLGADSLDMVDLIIGFEEEFGIVIPDQHAEFVRDVRTAIGYIDAKVVGDEDEAESVSEASRISRGLPPVDEAFSNGVLTSIS